jgi:CMP-N,N'-diacetyllegionaminic acid synthase
MTTLIVIPARKGSKSIHSKNLKLFCGKPLIYWTIKLALESNFGPVCVTTDSEEIRDLAITEGAQAPFLRPAYLAEDTTAIEPVLAHSYEYFSKSGTHVSALMLLMPTSPFRMGEDLLEAKKIYESSENCTSVFSVKEAIANENPHWMIQIGEDNRVTNFTGVPLEKMKTRRQDLPKVYIRNDYIYLFKPQNLYEKISNLYGAHPRLLVSDENRLDVDINTQKDWLIAEMLFANPKVFKTPHYY